MIIKYKKKKKIEKSLYVLKYNKIDVFIRLFLKFV